MASNFSSTPFNSSKVKNAVFEEYTNSKINRQCTSMIHLKDQDMKNVLQKQFRLLTHSSQADLTRRTFQRALSSSTPASDMDQNIDEDECCYVKYYKNKMEYNRVNCLVWVLHDSAARFSLAIRNLELARTRSEVSMAWIGVDVQAWHKRIAYQVAVYALLEAAIHVEQFLSRKRFTNPSLVYKILSPNTKFLRDHIESQLRSKNPKLVQWFHEVKLPRFLELFLPLFKKWSLEYAGSGVAGTVMALTCCASVIKLGPKRVACSSFSNSIEEALIELMNDAHRLVPFDKFHHLATKAGFEDEFLCNFGCKILPCKNIEDMEFWIGLVLKKLYTAFERESVAKSRQSPSNEIHVNSLAVLGLFAYLGRESRLFVSRHYIRDMDEQIKHFLTYLECGIVFIYPELSTISRYQQFMEVIIDEIGWLDFFASSNFPLCQERKRPKNHAVQAEAEMIFYTLFTTCYDVISGFAHYSNSTQQNALYNDLSEFLLHSQSLLSSCLEDHWAAYDKTGELPRIRERNILCSTPSFQVKGPKSSYAAIEARYKPDDLRNVEKCTQVHNSLEKQSEISIDSDHAKELKFTRHNFMKLSIRKLVSASIDIWIGTQLLFADISTTLAVAAKTLCGHKVTNRECKKIKRTIVDIATLVPVTILMLIPLSAVGHAAIFAAIKRYVPCLIPSSFTDERINSVKRLKRTKKMELKHVANTEL